jgi:SAM-dependent methyltransferase
MIDMEMKFARGQNAWKDFNDTIHKIIIENDLTDIAEIGGGANPLLSLAFVEKQKLVYQVIDVSPGELSKANAQYEKVVLDLERRDIEIYTRYDFIFSQLTIEHIKDIEAFYANIFKLLKPGGRACLFFACVTTLPALSNYLLPDFISSKILLFIQPFRKNEKHGKFRAYYRWCFGPTTKNIKRLENAGFKILSYTGYFGHSYYHRVPLIDSLEKAKTSFLLKHPNPYLCSYAHVLLKRND